LISLPADGKANDYSSGVLINKYMKLAVFISGI